jgi:glucose/arabinose dehydrogenase
MVVHGEKVYISHRDAHGNGVITAFNYDGTHSTIISDLPAAGDYSVTDLALNPTNGRLYFGVGAATNSGIVGLDNWATGWVEDHRRFSDVPYFDYVLNGFRFNSRNPRGGLFGGDDIASTGPFQPFGKSTTVRVDKSETQRPTAAIYSVNPAGGGHRVEAHGIRMPRGLAFNEFLNLYATNNGMELRGSRPVKDDPDALLRIYPGTWYGWPDYSTTLHPITDPRYKPDDADLVRTSWPELTFLLDHEASLLIRPNPDALLRGAFTPLAGASKMAFVPGRSSFSAYQGNAIVALSGDRAPFATNGRRLKGILGRKIVRVDVDKKEVYDFIRNTSGKPASMLRDAPYALERPFDVKFGPDGALYIVDMGRLVMKNGREIIKPHTGQILRLVPIPVAPTTEPIDESAE